MKIKICEIKGTSYRNRKRKKTQISTICFFGSEMKQGFYFFGKIGEPRGLSMI